MTWRIALAVTILLIWFGLLVDARSNPVSKDLFNTVNPVALAAVTFIFAEPVIRERRKKGKRQDDDD